MHVLMIGTRVPREIEDYLLSVGQRPSAANVVQEYMIHGLNEIDEVETLDAFGATRIPSFLKCQIVKLSAVSQKLPKGQLKSIGYLNLPIVGFWAREAGIVHAARKWAEKYKDGNVAVLVYSMHSPFMNAAAKVKEIIPSAKIVLTVADLPLFMNNKGRLRMFAKQLDWKRIKKLMRTVDKYLLYTKYMAEYLALPDKKWMVFEGLIDASKININEKKEKNGKRICVYAGNLNAQYGIDTLIDAFGKVKSDAELHIYGGGFDTERITALAEKSANVKYMGILSPEEMFETMKTATLLINPRPSTLGLAKYSCPSKTFEYMASGTPILMTKLPGLPEEYYDHIFYTDSEDADGFAAKINELFSLSDDVLIEKGRNAERFLMENKNSSIVMKNVIAFIK